MNYKFQPRRHTVVWATCHRKQLNQMWILKTWWLIEAESDLPGCVCEYAMRLVCHHSLIPLRCLPNQRCLHLQTPRARWSAWCLCSPLEYPSGLASLDSWPQLLHTEYGSKYVIYENQTCDSTHTVQVDKSSPFLPPEIQQSYQQCSVLKQV